MPSVRVVLRVLAALLVLVLAAAASPARAQESGGEAALGDIRQIDAGTNNGPNHTCAVLGSGQVRCWGYNLFRQLGDDTTSSRNRPVTVVRPDGAGPLTGATQVSAGAVTSCARLGSGQVRCWGNSAPRAAPVVAVGGGPTTRLTGVAEVSAGHNHTCARLTSGQARCWGSNADGQLGTGNTTPSSTPVVVQRPGGGGPLTGVTQIAAGLSFTCARLGTGQAVCWGTNDEQQLGDNTDTRRELPVYVTRPDGTGRLGNVRAVTTGWFHACARLGTGQARCWGSNSSLSLGAGPIAGQGRPVAVKAVSGAGALTGVTSIQAGGRHTCARLETARIVCWGRNQERQLGDRTTTARDRPVVMVNTAGNAPLSGATAVATGEGHTCALLANRTAVCVGRNDAGQLGDGTNEDTGRPVGVAR